ncbi:folate-binding protein YgfZ [Rhizobiaceae bacterium CRRU44]|uniref:Folate-binding protein YgfZ n=1 Tax=Ferranicluibacter rubi TaxID=2715133 RepID=A0AA43ZD96_9HYPH|nr:folate-binding protein YgfZ [Ferranicluibacter rubi]NHT74940.1 folate-binding protein YgfZ [Ferranicluibacter rubi]
MSLFAVPDRALVTVSGETAVEFLQALITTDVIQLTADEVRPGALLTPQGKILFDFLVSRTETGLRLETGAEQAPALLKRLTLYKLRAPITLALDTEINVAVSFDAVEGALLDVRFATSGAPAYRVYGTKGIADTEGRVDDARIAGGIAVSGADYALQDAFPHDILLDRNGGLSFRKGCYVGQEVVSRMQHRGTARRRVVTVEGMSDLPASGTAITAGGKPIGTLGSVAGRSGLAIVRIDKAGDALASQTDILAGDVKVALALPAWTGLAFPVPSPNTETSEAGA